MRYAGPDIRAFKNALRSRFKAFRTQLSQGEKAQLDEKIFQRLISLQAYKECELLLTFVSTAIEVDTRRLIEHSLECKKKVAVPKCIKGTRLMEFYFINSFDDLEPATFGVLEPITQKCERAVSFDSSVCIVPGLAFDLDGYRLGYGKGYYDRFLSGYEGKTIGICYCGCVTDRLPRGKFDKNAELLITEKFVKSIGKEDKNGR